MSPYDARTREQRKKILLLEGALHRLELVEARARLKTSIQGKAIVGMIKPLLTVEKLLPLAGGLLPLLLGKGTLGAWVRRALILAGAGTMVLSVLRNRRQASLDKEPDEGM